MAGVVRKTEFQNTRSSASITYKREDASVQLIEMDAIISEGISESVSITSHPIEDGSQLSDHVSENPVKLTMDCFVTNTPVRAPSNQNDGIVGVKESILLAVLDRAPKRRAGGPRDGEPAPEQSSTVEYRSTVLSFPDTMKRVKSVFDLLTERMYDGQLFTVNTSIRSYNDMMLESVETLIEAKGGNSITMKLVFVKVTIVSTVEVKAKPATQRAKKKDSPGPQSTTDAEVSDADRASFLFNATPAKKRTDMIGVL